MKFLWFHNIPHPREPIALTELFCSRESLKASALLEKLLRKWVEISFEISLVCNYAECYGRHLIYWVGVVGGTNGQRAFENGTELPNHRALSPRRLDTIR